MAKERYCRLYSQGTSTYQALLLQIVEKGGRRKNPRLQLAREMVILSVVAVLFLLVIASIITLVS